MTSGLARLCERSIEAGCLAALATVPLFFNPDSARTFEPDKALLLRGLALLLIVAWTVRALEWVVAGARAGAPLPPGSDRLTALLRRPLWLPALLAFLGYVPATLFSIDPHLSLWGSYQRLQGLLTTAGYAVVFFSFAAVTRTRTQTERAISVALLASFPVALYGVLQAFGLDPVRWAGQGRSPSGSTLGNVVFVAGFLVVVVPLCLHRLVMTASALWPGLAARERRAVLALLVLTLGMLLLGWLTDAVNAVLALAGALVLWLCMARALGQPRDAFLRLATYAILLSVLLAAIVATQSRGPFLGLVASLLAFGWLHALARRSWSGHLLAAGGAAVALLGLVTIAAPDSPLERARGLPLLGRLPRAFHAEGSVRARLLIWKGTTELLAENPHRVAVGHGPETLGLAFYPHYRPELERLERRPAVPDRAHNDALDTLAQTGFLGLSLRYVFVLSVLVLVLRWVGVVSDRRGAAVLVGLSVASSSALALGAGLGFDAWHLLGLAIPLGLLVALVLCGLARGLRARRRPPTDHAGGRGGDGRPLAIALGAALVAHLVEIQFGFGTVASLTYFWAVAGLLAAWAHVHGRAPAAATTATTADREDTGHRRASPSPPSGRAWRGPAADGFLVALILTTLAFAFRGPYGDVLQDPRAFALWAASFAFCAVVVLGERARRRRPGWRDRATGAAVFAAASLGAPILAVMVFRHQIPAGLGFHPALLAYPLLVAVVLGGYAWLTRPRGDVVLSHASRRGRLGYVALALVGLWLVRLVCLDPAEADVRFRRGQEAQARGELDDAVARYREALQLSPRQDHYHAFLARTLTEQAAGDVSPEARMRHLADAQRALATARGLRPLEAEHVASLARLHTAWALVSGGGRVPADRLEAATEHYATAIRMHPRRTQLWVEAGHVERLRGRTADAITKYRQALSLNPAHCETYAALAAAYRAIGDHGPLPELETGWAACSRGERPR